MELFLYKVKNESGRTLFGLVEASNEKEVKSFFLKFSDLYFLSAEPYNPKNLPKLRLKSEEILMFTHRLYHLIEAGLPILQALYILWKQSEQTEVQIIVSYIRKKLEDGSTLKEAFSTFTGVFSPMYLSLLGVAEIGAGLVKTLKKLVQYLEDQKRFVTQLKRALTYPIIVLVFAFLVLMGMFIFIIPMFQHVLTSLHAELPGLTVFLFGVSNFLRSIYFLLFLVLAGIGGYFAWKYIGKTRRLKYWVDYSKFKLPLIRTVLYPLYIGRFTRSLALLISSGVPLVTSLEVSKKTVVNLRIEFAVDEIEKQVTEGGSVYEAFKSTMAFPFSVVEMVGIGESSGRLHHILENVSNQLEEEADYALNKFMTYLEPALVVFVGGIVLTLFLGIYLPIFSIQGALRAM